MATLPTRSFDAIVSNIAAGMQGRVGRFLNFAIGSVLRAIAEAYAGICLWLQGQAIAIAKLTRLATSYNEDVDSFVADFPLSGVTRLGAQAATGLCNFSRFTAAATSVYVPVGGQVKTGDGAQVFQVIADTTNGAYVASYGTAGGYLIAPSTSSVTAPVQSITNGVSGKPGFNGNVAASAITLIASQMTGVDAVTNPSPFTNGFDSEIDDSVKSRFTLAVQARGGGTTPAIKSAVANLRVGMQATVIENQDLNGASDPGMVTVIVDDGSGNISSDLLAAAQAAVDGVRAAGIRTGTYAAVTTYADVVMQIIIDAGYARSIVVAQVAAALAFFINGQGQGVTLEYFDLPAVAKRVPGCGGLVAGSYKLNNGTVDIAGTPQSTIKARNLVIS